MTSIFYCGRCGLLIGSNPSSDKEKAIAYDTCPCTDGICNPNVRPWYSRSVVVPEGTLVVFRERMGWWDRIVRWCGKILRVEV